MGSMSAASNASEGKTPLVRVLEAAPAEPRSAQAGAVRAGVRIEQITIGWMVIEVLVALGAGALAHSVLLTAFGLDSVVELVTGGVLLWRLLTEARGDNLQRVERAENLAAWVTGVSLALLCLYILGGSTAALLTHTEPHRSYAGLIIATVAVIGMPVLARRKRAIAELIKSTALRGDAACSITCAYMAATLLAGLLLTAAFGWWWADSVAALGLLPWIVPEARKTLCGAQSGQGGCGCGDGCPG